MSNTRYLEFDSSYRNRNEWPLASEFQIPISQSGRKSQSNALDPVSLSTPIIAWTSNNLDKDNNQILEGTINDPTIPPVTPPEIDYISDNSTLIISTDSGKLQQLKNYYIGLILTLTQDSGSIYRRRIVEYTYLGNSSGRDIGQVTLSSNLPDSFIFGKNFSITDPTTLLGPDYYYFFVPSGRIQKNAYTGYVLYNETQKEYQPIIGYDSITHMVSIKKPVSNTWDIVDNYSIRKEKPLNTYQIVSSALYQPPSPPPPPVIIPPTITFTLSSSTIILQGSIIDPTLPKDYYKNFSVRIIPNSSNFYNYSLTSPVNESKVIYSSYSFKDVNTNNNTLVLITQQFTSVPNPSDQDAEIQNFSYDNFNPFTYTGSLVSQQEMVCYEVELLNLILPNEVLDVGEGGRIAFYPYVYVQLSNVSASSARNTNIIYSNNPNAIRAIFRVPIDDVINPLISTFIKVDGDGMVQTIKFKPNDNLFFSVFLSNGELYKTIIPEFYSPSAPNALSQISASFSIRRL